MKKRIRIISLVLSCIIIIGFVSLSYGADFEPVTGAAFGFSLDSGIKAGSSEIKATAANPVGSSTDPFYVTPKSASATRYYVNSSGNVATSSVSVASFADIVSYITYSIAYTEQYIASRLVNYLSQITPDVDDIRRYLNEDYWPLMNHIDSTLSSLVSNSGLDTLIPYFMPASTYDYTSNDWKQYILRTANSTSASTTTKQNESFILQFKDYLNANNLMEYWTYKREFDYVIPDDYASEAYNKWFNINTGAEYTAFKRSVWVDIRYINRFLSNFIYRTTGILSGTTFKLTDYSNTESTITPNSIYDYMRLMGENLSKSLGRLAFVLANDEDIALRQQTEDQQNAYKSNFTASGASARMSASDIGSAGDSVSELKSAFTSSASSRDAFNGFSAGTDGRWNWFSTEILNSLDTTTNNRKSNDNLTNFLGDYYNEVTKYAD